MPIYMLKTVRRDVIYLILQGLSKVAQTKDEAKICIDKHI